MHICQLTHNKANYIHICTVLVFSLNVSLKNHDDKIHGI